MQLPLLFNMSLPKHLANYLGFQNFDCLSILIMKRKKHLNNASQICKLTTVALHIEWCSIITVIRLLILGSDQQTGAPRWDMILKD